MYCKTQSCAFTHPIRRMRSISSPFRSEKKHFFPSAGNDELFDGAEICFDAGGQIYKLRRQILRVIGQAILGEVTGNSELTGTMAAAIADRIKDAAVTLQIETITFVNDQVPINTTNRPITIDQ